MKVIFILGLAHSGSTAVGFSLLNKNKTILLGEIENLIKNKRFNKRENSIKKCSCGRLIKNCSFWKDYFKQTFKDDLEKQKWIVEKAKKSGYETIIDTSKKIKSLKRWTKHVPVEVIYCIRPPLDWAISIHNSKIRGNEKIRRNLSWYCVLWYLKNYFMENKLKKIFKNYDVIKGEKIKIEEIKGEHHVFGGNRNKYKLSIK
jgi:hypothetical protein